MCIVCSPLCVDGCSLAGEWLTLFGCLARRLTFLKVTAHIKVWAKTPCTCVSVCMRELVTMCSACAVCIYMKLCNSLFNLIILSINMLRYLLSCSVFKSYHIRPTRHLLWCSFKYFTQTSCSFNEELEQIDTESSMYDTARQCEKNFWPQRYLKLH